MQNTQTRLLLLHLRLIRLYSQTSVASYSNSTFTLLDLSIYSTATDTDLTKPIDRPSHVSMDSPRYTRKWGRQKSGCVSPVSPIVANLYLEEVESRALITIPGTAPSYWFKYVDNTWLQIRAREAFREHLNAVILPSHSHRRMSEETVCPSWTVLYTVKKTKNSTLKCTKNKHTQINT